MEKFLKKYYKLIVLAIMAFFVTVSVLNAKNDSAIFDEVAHIPAGYSYLTQHDMRLNPEHPPLLKDLAAIPLMFLRLNFNTHQSFWTEDINGQWDAGRYFLYWAGNNPDMILFWSRIPIVILSAIFGLFIFMWARKLAGLAAGLFALMLYSFDPNILGHNHYVTTDLGIMAFLAFAMYFFLKFIKHPTWPNVLWGGIFLGLAHATKFSSVIILPVLGLVLVIYPLFKKLSYDDQENKMVSKRLAELGMYLLKGIAAFAVSMVVIWIIFFINTYKEPQQVLANTIEFYFPANDPSISAQYTHKILLALNQTNIGRPMSEYILGVAMVFKRVSGGNGAYFLGQVSSKAFPLYFPVVFLIKETIPFIFLTIFSLGFSLVQFIRSMLISGRKRAKEKFLRFMHVGVTEYTLFAFIALYTYISVTGNLNIGFRHLFPILPFAYLLITKKVFDFMRNKHVVTQRAFRYLFAALLVWIIAIPVFAYPNYMSYFNESIGGSQNGYKYVTDSNTDWGQDLKRLKIYLNQHPEIDKIRVDYFGGGDISYYIGDKYIMWYDSMRPVQLGWYAISTNFLQGSIYDTANKSPADNYAWTQQYIPVAEIGNSILIYHITKLPALK